MNVNISKIRHRWPEKAGFTLNRPHGAGEYILLHFLTSVELSFGGARQIVHPGAFIVFSPDTGHSFFSRERLVHDWMHLTGDVTEWMESFGLHPDTLYQPGIASEISEITAFLENEFWAERAYWNELSIAKLTELLIRISHSLSGENSRNDIDADITAHLHELRAGLLSEPELRRTVADMARKVNLSPSRFLYLYRSLFGISPVNDLIQIRIEKARALLSSGVSVSDVADQLGYSNVYHFIRQFRKAEGTTPKQYALRKAKQSDPV